MVSLKRYSDNVACHKNHTLSRMNINEYFGGVFEFTRNNWVGYMKLGNVHVNIMKRINDNSRFNRSRNT